MRSQIFVSYSHADSDYQLCLRKHLSAFERSGNITYWSDSQLNAGDLWKNEIESNIHKAAVAILLISADFLVSDFIQSNELPQLLKSWEDAGVYIIPVIVKPCNFSHVEKLSRFQAVNDPNKTIQEMSEAEQERTWANVARIAYDHLLSYQKQHNDNEHFLPEAFFRDNNAATNNIDDVQHTENYSFIPDMTDMEKDIIEEHLKNDFNSNYVYQQDTLVYDYVRDLLKNPKQIQSYYVYPYEHIDILDFLPTAKDFLGKYSGYNELIFEVKELFCRNNWEGDGTIRLMWFPPFLKIGIEDTWGTLAWFVKQKNNGTAFIASPVEIPHLSRDQHILFPDKDGYYTAQISEMRTKMRHDFRCFKIGGLLDLANEYVPNESHWLLYHAGNFRDPSINDWVRFKVKKLCDLRDFPDIKNTRNIYLDSLEIIEK